MVRYLWAVAGCSVLGAACTANANLIANGNFESGSLSPWTTNPGPNGDSIGVVNVSNGYYGAPITAANGTYAVAFNGGNTPPSGTLSQTFSSSLGVTYTVQFDYATNTGLQTIFASVVGVNGTLGSEAFTGSSDSFTTDTFTFVGDGGTDTLNFLDVASNNTNGEDGLLDNVSVVPEPAGISLLALGGLAVLGRRRRV